MSSRNTGSYYGWVIAFGAGLLLLVTNGMTLGGLSVFDEAILGTLQKATGQESMRGDLNLRALITFWEAARLRHWPGLSRIGSACAR